MELTLDHFWAPFFMGWAFSTFFWDLLRNMSRKGVNPPEPKSLEPEVKKKDEPKCEERYRLID